MLGQRVEEHLPHEGIMGGEEPRAATSAQGCWHVGGGGSPATSRTAENDSVLP